MPGLRQAAAQRRLLVVAVAAYLLGCVAALAGWHYAQVAHRNASVEAFGRTTAQDVARLAVEPLMRQDRVALGLVASQVAERPQVRGIAVRTVDGDRFVVVGEAVPPGSPAFVAPIPVQDSVVGNVTVTLDRGAFGLSLAGLVRSSWWWFAAGLLLAVAGGLVADRRRSVSPPAVDAQDDAAAEAAADAAAMPSSAEKAPEMEASGPFLLVANLFARAGQPAAEREEALRRGLAVAEAVAGQTGGEAAALADMGVALRFPGDGDPDAAYAAVRGALLLRAAMGHAALPPFRYALEQVPEALAAPAEAVTVMASVAADDQLLLGVAAAGRIEQPERLRLAAAESPAATVLPPLARPSQVVYGLAAEEAELAEEAAAVVAALA